MSVNSLILNKLTDLTVEDMVTEERPIVRIILHCTADKEGVNNTVESIRKYHVEHNHWDDIGYHYVIYLDGSIHLGRPVSIQGAHCKDGNNNPTSIGISYVGGLDKNCNAKDTRTPAQKESLYRLVHDLLLAYPGSDVRCHNEFANKACPSFQIETFREEYAAWLDANNIHDVEETPVEENPSTEGGDTPADNTSNGGNHTQTGQQDGEQTPNKVSSLLEIIKRLLSKLGIFTSRPL